MSEICDSTRMSKHLSCSFSWRRMSVEWRLMNESVVYNEIFFYFSHTDDNELRLKRSTTGMCVRFEIRSNYDRQKAIKSDARKACGLTHEIKVICISFTASSGQRCVNRRENEKWWIVICQPELRKIILIKLGIVDWVRASKLTHFRFWFFVGDRDVQWFLNGVRDTVGEHRNFEWNWIFQTRFCLHFWLNLTVSHDGWVPSKIPRNFPPIHLENLQFIHVHSSLGRFITENAIRRSCVQQRSFLIKIY